MQQSARTNPQNKYVPIRVRQREQADRVGESQHMSASMYTARWIHKTNWEIEICPAYKNMQLLTHRWCYVQIICLWSWHKKTQRWSSFRPFFYVFHTRMWRPGCDPGAWSFWHLQVVSLQLKPLTSLSASLKIWASVAAGGSRPRSEAPCKLFHLNLA